MSFKGVLGKPFFCVFVEQVEVVFDGADPVVMSEE
jgi:hypothetical protein